MDYKSVLKSARENLNGSCKVCKVCNGIACSGEVPGMGGKGTGVAFTENIKSLEKVKINMRVLHNVKNPDTSVEMFGKKMKAPIFAAPVSGTTLNMGGKYTEKEYISWVIEGCLKAGIYPMVGDTAIETFLTDNLEVLKEKNADGIAFIKPWENDAIISKMKLAEDAGVFALGVDVDACGLVTLSLHCKNVEPKTLDKIKELSPESLTVHTLAVKRTSKLKENLEDYELAQYEEMVKMISLAKEYASDMGLNPYYMYRQKHMLGNLENIGYAKEGYECIYNMQIMEEKQSNYALGAGSITKFVYPDEDRIERVENVKNVEQYINRVDEMINRKYKEVQKNVK